MRELKSQTKLETYTIQNDINSLLDKIKYVDVSLLDDISNEIKRN